MRFLLIRLVLAALGALVAITASAGRAGAVTESQCTHEGGGVIIAEMDGTRTCFGGFYTGLQILPH
ncbi:hypothetical protein IU449_13490 [Nocardia higoensis]|uniref:Secreted protein n=1 Tax=Nocardia higoensis TaxID=228599 RepID=A0ABS0DF57_9NOCA|nr:hypothetical protein [Nocardia higoensis]MBF6355544.1 hypothetical protein [Nocardia higoensis]